MKLAFAVLAAPFAGVFAQEVFDVAKTFQTPKKAAPEKKKEKTS